MPSHAEAYGARAVTRGVKMLPCGHIEYVAESVLWPLGPHSIVVAETR